MKRNTKEILAVGTVVVALPVSLFFLGMGLGQKIERSECRMSVRIAVDAEYTRVVGAIARTMRCQTEEEHAQGKDHECDPSEVEQDAGLR